MEIHINLLPEKPKRNYFLFFVFGLALGLFLLMLVIGTIYYQSIKREYKNVQNQIDMTIQLQETYSAESTEMTNLRQRQSQIDSLLADRISATFVLNELVKKLPQHASFLHYTYDEGGNIQLEAQFSNKREVSSYLHHLKQTDFVHFVMLESIYESDGNEGNKAAYTASFSIMMDVDKLKENGQEEDLATNDVAEEGAEDE